MMKFNPTGWHILVKLTEDKVDLKVSESLKNIGFEIRSGLGEAEFEKAASEFGVVVAVGPSAFRDEKFGYGKDFWEPWCKVGDEILFSKYAGKLVHDPDTKDDYMVINDEDVKIVLERKH